ncbi:MAG: PAS domain S-box protein [Deltaproteobacteria bacterium]
MPELLRILILEDNPADAELIQFELQDAGILFSPIVVVTEKDYVHELLESCPDLILSDYDLPHHYTGAMALAEANKSCPDTPFILVTGAVSEDRAIEILTQGAKDYVLKTRLQQRLVPAVQRALAEAAEHRARKQAEEDLREAHRTLERQVEERTKALQLSEKLYHSLFENMLDGFAYCRMIYDRGYAQDFVFLDINRSFTLLTGLDNVIGKRASEVIPGIRESDGELFETYSRVALTGKSEKFEIYVKALQMWFSVSVYSPEKEYFVAVFDVVTERKRVEEALRESEGRYRLLAETLLQGVVHQNASGRIIAMNPAAERILGKNLEDFLGSSSVQEEHDTIRENGERFPGIEHPAMVALRTGLPVNGVIMGVFNPKLGDYRWISIDAVPVFRPGETHPSEVYTVFEDITERKRTEEELRRSEHLYRAIGETIDYGIWVTDSNGRNMYSSKSLLDLVGLTQEQCSNFGWMKVLHPDDTERTIKAWQECVRTGSNWNIEHRFRGVDGQWYSVLARGVPVRNEKGEVIFWAGINLDISELKKAEMVLKERTRQLEEANRELESFSYSVSHDLRAPLRAINGFSRKLEREYGDKGDEKFARMINVIRSNTRVMDALIEDLLSFSKVQNTGMNIAVIDMARLVSEVWDDILAANKKRELKFRTITILPGYGDRTLIRQVFFNLLSNAVKFTRDRRPGIIEISSHVESDKIVYCVKDNGAGFDMQYYDKLFGVFQRLHSHEEYEGTGIGLAIVQRIIKRHGGHVWAEGEVDMGATFCFSLPSKQTP